MDNLETMKTLERISKEINNRYLKLKDGSPRTLKNSVILDRLYKIKQYDVVKKTFPILKTTNKYPDPYIPEAQDFFRFENLMKV